eukprot:3444155-Lingulodinium_polyedra.AAC.1
MSWTLHGHCVAIAEPIRGNCMAILWAWQLHGHCVAAVAWPTRGQLMAMPGPLRLFYGQILSKA